MSTHDDGSVAGPSALPQVLAGRTVVIAADRRSVEFAGSLERRGARVWRGPAMRNVPLADDVELIAATRALVASPPDIVVITTGVGFRGWFEAAASVGLEADLAAALGSARVLARGPKSRGAIIRHGIEVEWTAESETSAEVLAKLLTEDVSGKRIAVQHHGAGADGLDTELADAGADVVSLVVYKWGPPADPQALATTLRACAAGEVDVVAFTAAPGVVAWFDAARDAGLESEILERFAAGMVAAAVGPVTAAPLIERGVTPIQPERFRLGALTKEILEHFSS